MCIKTHVFYGILSSGSVLGDVSAELPACSLQTSHVPLPSCWLERQSPVPPCAHRGLPSSAEFLHPWRFAVLDWAVELAHQQ